MRTRRPRSVADDIRSRSVVRLQELIVRRPDLVTPMPTDLNGFAAKVTEHASVQLAIDDLDLDQLALLQLFCGAQGVQVSGVQFAAAGLAEGKALELIEDLWVIGLLWGVAPTYSKAVAVSSDPSASLLPSATLGPSVSPEAVAESLHVVSAVRHILGESLAEPQVGAFPVRPTDGLSEQSNRGQDSAGQPDWQPVTSGAPDPSQQAQLALAALVRIADTVQWFSKRRTRLLRSGGISVRDFAALSQDSGVELAVAAFYAELAAHAGFLGSANCDQVGSEWGVLETSTFVTWSQLNYSEQWRQLVTAWQTFTSVPELVGSEAADGYRLNLLDNKTTCGILPSIRTFILQTMATGEPDTAISYRALRQLVDHRFPRVTDQIRMAATRQIVAEATSLGILIPASEVAGSESELVDSESNWIALSSLGRAWLAKDRALAELFPETIDQLITQADMTLVVPGLPSPKLRRFLDRIASRESTGGATVYRLTPVSLRAGLASGEDPDEVVAKLRSLSLTPLPQPMEYLIRDAANARLNMAPGTGREVEHPEANQYDGVTRAERRLAGYSGLVGNTRGDRGSHLTTDEAHYYAKLLQRTVAGAEPEAVALPATIPVMSPQELLSLFRGVAKTPARVAIALVDSEGVASQLDAEVVGVQSGSVTVLDRSEMKIIALRRSRIVGAVIQPELAEGDVDD